MDGGNFHFTHTLTKSLTNRFLVSRKHILSAAHCIKGDKRQSHVKEKNCYIALGFYDLTDEEEGTSKATISKFILHPSWKPKEIRKGADIALAVLSKIINYTEFITPICMFSESVYERKLVNAIFSGWGATSAAINIESHSNVALEARLGIHDRSECALGVDPLTPKTICAGHKSGPGACAGYNVTHNIFQF